MKKYLLFLVFGVLLVGSLLAGGAQPQIHEQRTVVLVECTDVVFTQSVVRQTRALFRRYTPVVTEDKNNAVTIEATYGRDKVVVRGFIDDQKRKVISINVPNNLSSKAHRWLAQIEKGTKNNINKSGS